MNKLDILKAASKAGENWDKFTDKCDKILPAVIIISIAAIAVVAVIRFARKHIR